MKIWTIVFSCDHEVISNLRILTMFYDSYWRQYGSSAETPKSFLEVVVVKKVLEQINDKVIKRPIQCVQRISEKDIGIHLRNRLEISIVMISFLNLISVLSFFICIWTISSVNFMNKDLRYYNKWPNCYMGCPPCVKRLYIVAWVVWC